MVKALHCADLHLSVAEAGYSLSVLDEIVDLARRLRVALLLLAGDIFDSFDDLERLRGEFRNRIASLPEDCQAIMIPGNHEQLGRGKRALGAMDLGRVRWVVDPPFSFFAVLGIEILCIPFSRSYADYAEWKVPPKEGGIRLALAHGPVSGMHFGGIDSEDEREGVLDPDLFDRLQVDYAALGHIHAASAERLGAALLCYPGSSRVWRSGESGPRCINLVEAGAEISFKQIALAGAGEYRSYELPLDLDGSLPDLGRLAAGWSAADWIRISVTGVVEDERSFAEALPAYARAFGKGVRKLDVERDRVVSLPGISSQPIARKFLELWKTREPAANGDAREIWLRARETGLLKIKELLEGQP